MGLDQYLYTSKSEDPEEKIEDNRALAQWRKAYLIDEYLQGVGKAINHDYLYYVSRKSLVNLLNACMQFYIHEPITSTWFKEVKEGHCIEPGDWEIQNTIEQLTNVLHQNSEEQTFIYLRDY